MHAEGLLAGELKHGPLALVDATMPIVMVRHPVNELHCICFIIIFTQIVTNDANFTKSENALQQVVARGGRPIIICNKVLRMWFASISPNSSLLSQQERVPAIHGKTFRSIQVPQTVDCLQVCSLALFLV